MSISDIYKIKHRFVTRQIGDDMVLVPVETNVANMNELFTMNSTASFIWKHVDGVNTEEDIIRLLQEEFDVDMQTAERDLNDFLDQLDNF